MSVSPPRDDVIKNDLAQQGEQQDDEGSGVASLRGGAENDADIMMEVSRRRSEHCAFLLLRGRGYGIANSACVWNPFNYKKFDHSMPICSEGVK
jgi:hypothetical protein